MKGEGGEREKDGGERRVREGGRLLSGYFILMDD